MDKVSVQDIPCPRCGKVNWIFKKKFTTFLGSGNTIPPEEEIRCFCCNKKATTDLEGQIRETEEFAQLQIPIISKEEGVGA